ncbi:chromo domain containing protein [Gossypium australe]|uniref:Chromo domain containing protein n=1 Tax=Gossypium australe TaxID=47621 RepID=A0A5B6X1A3_9ROSI|nr:chromo domain containing protein [Gossypium australe]
MILAWKWDTITMDFISGLPLSPKKKDAIRVVVDQLMKSAHFIMVCTDYSLDKLAELYIAEIVRMQGVLASIISDRDPSISVEENTSFWSQRQIESTIRPYEIIKRIGPVAYPLALPSELEKIHNVFHLSMLQWYRSDPSYIISLTEIEIQPDMTYSEELIKILALEVKELRNKHIGLDKFFGNDTVSKRLRGSLRKL